MWQNKELCSQHGCEKVASYLIHGEKMEPISACHICIKDVLKALSNKLKDSENFIDHKFILEARNYTILDGQRVRIFFLKGSPPC